MKKIIVLLLTLTIPMVFTSCQKSPQEIASAAERTTSTVTGISSELESREETNSVPTSTVAPPESVLSEQAPTSSPSSVSPPTPVNSAPKPSTPSPSATCTHPDYWEGKGDGMHFITGWYDKKPGIEHKFTLNALCEEPRDVLYKCPVCSEPVLVETLPPSGHDFSGEEEILQYPSVTKEGCWGIRCKSPLSCFETKRTTAILKRGGSYDNIDACFTVDISRSDNLETYTMDDSVISISDYRTWGSVPTIEFDTESYTGTIRYVLQDGTLYEKAIVIDKSKLNQGYWYSGRLLESGEYKGTYYSLSSNGTGFK